MTVRARMVFCYIVVRQAAGLSKSLLANLVLYITRLGRLAACRTCAVLAMTLLAVVQSMAATPRERSFQVEYVATIKDIPTGAKTVDLWIPVPHEGPFQKSQT
ncbi:MAG TPA: hypothetical protein VN937_06720 [Blastocatellia bacterium]|nr:hypothetical protein [Blastocatellia bacterium]